MVKPHVLEERPLLLAELKEKLGSIKEKEKELNFRANKTEEYLVSIPVLGAKDAKELAKKLANLDIPRMKQEHIVKIVDLLPHTGNDVKMVLQNSVLTLSAESLKKITDVVAEYAKQ